MAHSNSRSVSVAAWLVSCLVVSLVVVAVGMYRPVDAELWKLDESQGSDLAAAKDELSSGPPARFATTIRTPSGPPVIELDAADPQGRVGSIACSTCHSVREPNFANRTPADLDEFHQNMPLTHGTIACYACHHPTNADSLRLADGTSVAYTDVMTLCAQCHGTQARDYAHGAHGGMNGYWDLSRGPRTRNNCIDCHDPHSPQFPKMQPTFKPRDRFLTPTSHNTPEPSGREKSVRYHLPGTGPAGASHKWYRTLISRSLPSESNHE